MGIEAKVIADSISPEGDRLTTFECTFHRFILSEFNTHRKFSRNSASSRAIPVTKIIDQVLNNPAIPIKFPQEQPGMSGTKNEVHLRYKAEQRWRGAAIQAVKSANALMTLKVHKSVINRLLEPFMWHTVVVSSTEWHNFFAQRISPDAQPEINDLAEKMKAALDASVPQRVDYGGWHLPYVTEHEQNYYDIGTKQALSVARVAGVSYNRLGKIRELDADLNLYNRLISAMPPHWSPFEHVATPSELVMPGATLGNFDGWRQLRHILDTPFGKKFAEVED